MTRHHLVVGAGGLFGQAIVAQLRESSLSAVEVSGLNWSSDAAVYEGLKPGVVQLLERAKEDQWVVHWCAGKATVRSDELESGRELILIRQLIGLLETTATPTQLRRGSLTFASSAGGVYANSLCPPFDERSAPVPSTPYGRAKLATERLLTEWCESHGVRLTIGRIASLYGSNQDLSKPQGLLSHLVRAAVLREPLTVFVPLSTTRNYIAVNDAARLLLMHDAERTADFLTVNICASENFSVAALLRMCEIIARRRVLVRQIVSDAAMTEPLDLRLSTIFQAKSQSVARTSLHVGLHMLMASALRAGTKSGQ